MKPSQSTPGFTRRQFMAGGAALAAMAAQQASAAASKPNPYEYKVDHLFKTDPKLILYDQTGRLACPHPDARRISITTDDTLLVACGKFVTLMDKSGNTLSEIKLPETARCVTRDAFGTVFVGLRDRLQSFDKNGQRLSDRPAPAAKTWFTGLAITEQHVFAADAGNRIVWRLDKAGKATGRIGEKNKDRNIPGLIAPSPFLDVEIAKDGLLRVTNPGRHLVEAYTFDGDLEFSWGKPTMAVDGFCGCCNPINIALLSDGGVITCEKGLPRVKLYGERGQFIGVVAGPESFPESLRSGAGLTKSDGSLAGMDAAVDSQGRVYILDQVAGEIRIMSRKAAAATSARIQSS